MSFPVVSEIAAIAALQKEMASIMLDHMHKLAYLSNLRAKVMQICPCVQQNSSLLSAMHMAFHGQQDLCSTLQIIRGVQMT